MNKVSKEYFVKIMLSQQRIKKTSKINEEECDIKVSKEEMFDKKINKDRLIRKIVREAKKKEKAYYGYVRDRQTGYLRWKVGKRSEY